MENSKMEKDKTVDKYTQIKVKMGLILAMEKDKGKGK